MKLLEFFNGFAVRGVRLLKKIPHTTRHIPVTGLQLKRLLYLINIIQFLPCKEFNFFLV